jgi:hypothetical protein
LWEDGGVTYARSGDAPGTRTLGPEGALMHETPVTTGLDARPHDTLSIPHPTYLPFVLGFGLFVLMLGLLVDAVLIGAIGVAFTGLAVTWWTWRTDGELV